MFWNHPRERGGATGGELSAIHPSAEIADDVEIGPFSCIGPNCRIGPGTRLANNVTLVQNVTLGARNEVHAGAVIGGLPQDKKYCGEESRVEVGDDNIVRESVTIHSGTSLGGGLTRIGHRNLVMACCHVAHDCIIENDVTMANNVLLGGHVRVQSFASFGGMAAVHHFVTVGQHSFVGGLTRVTQDVPPYMLLEGNPSRIWSINKVGLRRRGVKLETIKALKIAHRLLFRSGRPRAETVQDLSQAFPQIDEIRFLCEFLREADQSTYGRARQPALLEGDGGGVASDGRFSAAEDV